MTPVEGVYQKGFSDFKQWAELPTVTTGCNPMWVSSRSRQLHYTVHHFVIVAVQSATLDNFMNVYVFIFILNAT
jgi:hypothetical protein